MLKIGVIGGLGWVSTAAYYRRLNELAAERAGGVTSARIVLESVDRQAYVDAVFGRRDEAAARAQIEEAALCLESARADFVVIACDDVHRFVPQIEDRVAIPFLHIADCAAASIAAHGIRKVAVLGVRKTMEADVYAERLARRGIGTVALSEDDASFVHETIYDELVHGVFRDETRRRYCDLIDELAARGTDGVVLACTELPLLLGPQDARIPLFDTVELHCRAAIARAFGRA